MGRLRIWQTARMTIRITAITPDGKSHVHPTSRQNGEVELVSRPDGSFQVVGEFRSGARQVIAEYPAGTEFVEQ